MIVHRSRPTSLLSLLATTSLLASTPAVAEPVGPDVLDAYLSRPEPDYHWRIERRLQQPEFTAYVVDMTSQQWLTDEEVDRTRWQHWLTITLPAQLRHSTAMLLIGGGRNGGDPPEGPSGRALRVAAQTGAAVVELAQVPNQPLVFNGDGQPRYEDDLLAYAGRQFMETGETKWVARLPMVKSAVKAMDTAQEVVRQQTNAQSQLDHFIVVGASKRGWTTWLVGSADPRVVAVVPLVIDCLNATKSMQHHVASYGFWAPAVGDYVKHGILQRMATPPYQRLLAIDDPYVYRHRVTMPKFVVNSTGDQFFLPDSSQFYFDDLVGEKHLRYVPNTNHSLEGSDAADSLIAFSRSILEKGSRPEYSWRFGDDGAIEVQCTSSPAEVRLWKANNPDARDFRLRTIGPAYRSTKLTATSPGRYVAARPENEAGWTAYFIEMEFPADDGPPLKFTTGVRVTPEKLPHADALEQGEVAVGVGGQ